MKQASPSTHLELRDPEAVRVLTDPKALRYLEPLLGRERSVGQLAQELGVDTSSALYRVRQFLRLGLARQTRLEPRRGRAVKYYGAVADSFYAPFSSTPHATPETLPRDFSGTTEVLLEKSVSRALAAVAGAPTALGVHVYRHADGRVSRNITPRPPEGEPTQFFEALCEPDAPAVWSTWRFTQLSREAAKGLQAELASVFERHQDDEKGSAYIIRLAMAPVIDSD